MEKVLLSAKQAAELSLEKGYEWFKNQVFKQIRETAERGESELHWGISYPFLKDYLEDGDFNSFYRALEIVIKAKDTVSGFAEKVGMSRTHLYSIFKSEKEPKFSTIVKIF